MVEQSEDCLVTAKVAVSLPFRTSIKEGELYEVIEKTLNNTAKVKIYPLEYVGTITQLEHGNYVSNFRKIKIDVTLPVSHQIIDYSEREFQRPFMDAANHYLNLFLLHCKTKSKQFWLVPLRLNDFNMSQFWYEVQFLGESNEILYEVKGTTGGLEPVGTGINKEVWDKIRNDIMHDVQPSIVDYHIEEARDAIFSQSIELLIINTAVAFEIFTSRFCFEYARKINKDSDPYLKCILEGPTNFVVNYLKKIIPHLTSNKLDTNHYDQIDYLFRTRNKIVHEGKSYYKDKRGVVCQVDVEKAKTFFLTVCEAMEWFRSIDSAVADQLKCFIDTK